ncbi:MAG: 16S rRNA (uracil(1498)-N(3))-methyltransferase, partial [Burkholderiales bacterium]
WIVEKAVELGAARIVPVQCARSVARLAPERAARRMAHWRQVMIAACMQCGRNRLPELAQPIAFERFVRSEAAASAGAQPAAASDAQRATRLVLVPGAERRLVEIAAPRGPAMVLIGPEAGLSAEEVELALAHGFVAVRLGPRTLRTETAGIAALAALQSRFGDF